MSLRPIESEREVRAPLVPVVGGDWRRKRSETNVLRTGMSSEFITSLFVEVVVVVVVIIVLFTRSPVSLYSLRMSLHV